MKVDRGSLKFQNVCADDGNTYTRAKYRGYDDVLSPGAPELPCTVLSFLMPTYSNNFSISVSGLSPSKDYLEYPLYPVQRQVRLSTDYEPVCFTKPDSEVFDSLSGLLYADIIDEQMLSGRYHIISVKISPFEFECLDNSITTYGDVEVGISYDECDEQDMTLDVDTEHNRKLDYPLESLVCNPQDEVFMVINNKTIQGINKAPYGYNKEYHIVAPANLCSALEPLVTWKSQKGYKVILSDIESIYNDSRYKATGKSGLEDNAASLRAYLRDCYNACKGNMFCLLVGHPSKTNMPVRYYSKSFSGPTNTDLNTEDFIPTDSYFSNVRDHYNMRYDEHNKCHVVTYDSWCSPQIIIGRLLCSSTGEIENYISKLILYESNPGRGDADYLKNILFVEQECIKTTLLGTSEMAREAIYQYMDVKLLQDNAFDNSIWPTGSDILKAMRESSLTSFHGHGNPTHIAVSSGLQNKNSADDFSEWRGIVSLDSYTEYDINGNRGTPLKAYYGQGLDLLDNFSHPSVIYSTGCSNAPMDYLRTIGGNYFDCLYNLAESFTVGGRYGGPAFLGYSRDAYVSRAQILEKYFMERIISDPCVGRAENYSKTKYYDTYTRHAHYLCGDPEFEIWVGELEYSEHNLQRISNQELKISSNTMSNGVFLRFDGCGNSVWENFNGSIIMKSSQSISSFVNSPFIAYALWDQYKLPVIELRNAYGNIDKGSFNFVVRNVELGNDEDIETPVNLNISGNCKLDILTVDYLALNHGVRIGGSSKVNCTSMKDVSMHGVTLTEGSSTCVKGENVTLGKDFKIEGSAEFLVMTE